MSSSKKERATTYLEPKVIKALEVIKEQEGFKNLSSVIEEAVDFYQSYRIIDSEKDFLSEGAKGAVQDALAKTDNRMGANLFKVSVELGMIQHLLATAVDVTDDELRKLRGLVVKEVKQSKGIVKLDKAIEFQVRDEEDEEDSEW